MNRWRLGLAAAAIVAPSLAGPARLPTAAAAPPAATPSSTVTIDNLSFQITVGTDLSLTVSVPDNERPAGTSDAPLRVDIAPIDSRQALGTALDQLTPTDSVVVVGRSAVRIPTQRSGDRQATLTFDRAGVHALRVAIDRNPATAITTFVNVVDPADQGADDEPNPLPVAVVVGADPTVRVDDDGVTRLDRNSIATLDQLIKVLDASAVPLSVHLPPGTVNGLDNSPASLSTLAASLSEHELLSEPALPLDPSAAAAAGQGALYTQWLRDGEDAASATLRQPPRRLVGVVRTPLSRGGGQLRRDLGNRLLLFTAAQFDALPDTPGLFFDPAHVARVALANSSMLDAMIPDRLLSSLLAEPPGPAVANTARRIVAELLTIRRQITDSGDEPGAAGVVLATATIGLPAPELIRATTTLLGSIPTLRPVFLDALAGRVTPVSTNDGDLVVTLDETPPLADLLDAGRLQTMRDLGDTTAAVASLLPVDDSRAARWLRQLQALPSSAVSDDQADKIVASVRGEQQAIAASVVPPAPFNATLGSRRATLRLHLTNRAAEPRFVRVRLSSGASKVNFPENLKVHELAPNAVTEVAIPIEARSNGRIPVVAEVLTPSGDQPIAAAVPLTLTVNGFAGLGYLLSGAAGLILATWWVRHHRRASAARRAPADTLGPP